VNSSGPSTESRSRTCCGQEIRPRIVEQSSIGLKALSMVFPAHACFATQRALKKWNPSSVGSPPARKTHVLRGLRLNVLTDVILEHIIRHAELAALPA